MQASAPSDISESVDYESCKSDTEIAIDDWIYADGVITNQSNRDLLAFDIYRDDNFLISVGSDVYTYLDLGLENGTQYCYYIIAEYDEGFSQPTATVCAAPDAGPMCPPENLSLTIEDGDEQEHES